MSWQHFPIDWWLSVADSTGDCHGLGLQVWGSECNVFGWEKNEIYISKFNDT